MSVGPGGTPVRGQLVSLPAWLFPPSDCRPLDLTTPVPVVVPAVNVVTDAPGEALVLTFDVPLGARLRVTGLGCSSADPSDLAMISWAVRTNGNPYNGYQYLPAPVGTMAGTGSGDGVAASPSAPVAVNANLFSLTAVTTRVLAGEERPPHDDMAESVTSNVSDAPVVPWSIKNVLRNRLTSVAAAVKSPKGGKAGQPGAFAFK